MSKFFINRPIVAIVIAIVTVLVGLVSMRALPIAQYPEIVPPQLLVTATYPGADAVTLEQSVATPIEQQMNGVDDMLYMQSINANDGTTQLQITFEADTDVNTDQVNVQNRLAQAQANLPPEVNQFGLLIRKSTGLPLLAVSLYSPKKTRDSLFLGNYANINLVDALLRVPGVGQVLIFGTADYAMRIWVKPDVLAKLGLSVPDLSKAIQQQSAVNPAGQVGASPAPSGQEQTLTVRARGRLQTAEEFGQVVVRSNADGSVVRLKDVARIELGALAYKQIGRLNGLPSSIVAIFQTPGSNALAVATGVKKTMDELAPRLPEDVAFAYSLDSTLPVTEGIREIVITLFEAMALVVIVVFLFLQNWRATIIPMAAVPVSLIGTFAVFPLLGFSINTLSLFGLVLAVGLVVDDAIVVVEAVEHHIEQGMSPRDATARAMQEVSGPVISIALILASVFVPIAFMGGIQGRLNKQFALTIAVSVIISAFNALTLSPALSAMLLRPRKAATGAASRFFGVVQPVVRERDERVCGAQPPADPEVRDRRRDTGGVLRPRRGARQEPADELRARRRLRVLLPERAAAAGGLARTDRRGLPAHRTNPRGDAGHRQGDDGRRVQPADAGLVNQQRVLLHRAQAVGGAPRRRAPGARHRRSVERHAGEAGDRRPRRSGSCRRRSPAWATRAGSRSGCRTAAAARSSFSISSCRRSWPRRGSGRSSPASRPCTRHRCRSSTPTSIRTRRSSRAWPWATSTRRSRRFWAAST